MNAPIDRTSNPGLGSEDFDADPSGHIVIRLEPRETHDSPDLRVVAAEEGLQALQAFLASNQQLKAQRVIRHTTPDVLRAREETAGQTAFGPIETMTAYWRLDVRSEDDPEAHRSSLHNMPEISVAYHEMGVAAAVENPLPPHLTSPDAELRGTNTYESDQKFLDAKPVGIGAVGAWTRSDGNGTGVNVVDLEEGWILAHEDLPRPQLLYGDMRPSDVAARNHGAAALGIVAGVDNDIGVIGVAPRVASLNTVSHYEACSGTNLHVADAVDAATKYLRPGDILLLEVQRYDTNRNAYPTEVDSADLHSIRHAAAQGIIVIEAAGNGGINGGLDLDAWTDSTGQHSLDRSAAGYQDSGATMVGSAYAMVLDDPDGTKGHRRYYTSNYGSRLDVYAWGEHIYTTGYGDLAGQPGGSNCYTNDFGQTSGASAIIAGSAAVLQSWYKGLCGEPLSPDDIRRLLSNPATGTPQVLAESDRIGVMPDLEAIMAAGIQFKHKVRNVLKRVRLVSGAAIDPFQQYRTGVVTRVQ